MTIYYCNTRKHALNLFSVLVLFLMSWSIVNGQEKIRFKTVVIDPGHGGKDSGAQGSKANEKDIVLNVALKLGEYINEHLPEVKVVYTRDKDVFIPLDRRAEIANENKADLFISIHANYISKPSVYGAETFVLGNHRTNEQLEVAKQENSVILYEEDYSVKYEGFDPNSSESYIMFQLMQFAFLDQSQNLAGIVQDQFTNRVGRKNRGVKQAGFLVLRKTSMPSILVELGFLSNKVEEKFMISEEGQTYLASALFRSVRDYKTQFELNNGIEEVKKKEKVTYRVQVASSPKKLSDNARVYSQFPNVWEYIENNKFKYTTGETSDYNEILKIQDDVRTKIADAFVVAFLGEERISLDKAQTITK